MTSPRKHTSPPPGVFHRCKLLATLLLCTAPLPLLAQLFTPGITEAFGSGPTYTPTRWVDPSHPNSSDTGPGSLSQPWKKAPGMQGWTGTYTPAAGDVIALKRGGLWRLTGTWVIPSSGSSTTSPIVYTAYDDPLDPNAPLPKVTVLEDIKGTTGTWTAAGTGYPNVYYRAITGTVTRVYINGVGLGEAIATTPGTENWVGQNSKVTCLALPTPNPNGRVIGTKYDTGILKAWKQATVSGQVRLYLHSPGGSPNTLSNTSVEALKGGTNGILYAVRCLNRSHVYLDRIAFNGGTDAVVDLRCGAGATFQTNVRVTNCDVRCGQEKGVNVWSLAEEDTVAPIEPRGFTNGLIKWNRVDSGDGPGTRPTSDTADFGGQQPVYPYPGDLLGSNDGISLWNGVQNWTIAQNDVSNFWHSNINISRTDGTQNPSVVVTSDNLVEHNNSHSESINYSHGLSIGCAEVEAVAYRTNHNVGRYNHIYNTWSGGSLKGRNVKFYGNLMVGVYGSPRDPIDHIGWAGVGYMVLGFDNPSPITVIEGGLSAYNTYVNCAGAAINISDYKGAPPTGYVVANNIMAYCGNKHNPANIAFRDSEGNASNIDVDNNLMYSPGNPTGTLVYMRKNAPGPDTMTVADMQIVEPAWDDNIQADPQFINYTGINSTGNYKLKPTSPAWGAAKDITSILPESEGWTDLGCWQEAGASTFVTAQTLGGNQNGYDGWKGMKITVGSNPLVITDLGRWVTTGNSQQHALKLVNAAGVTIASTSVDTSGPFVEQFKYGALANPMTLSAGAVYYIVSRETVGGDMWKGHSSTLTYNTSVATINNAVRASDSLTLTFTNDNTTLHTSNGPLSFKYYNPVTFVTGQTLSQNSYNGYSGWLGMKITVGNTPIIVTELGRWVLAGNNQAHTVKVVNASGVTLGSVSVATSGATTGQIKYVPLTTPVVLDENTVNYVVSQEVSGGDFWWGSGTLLNHTAAATIDGAVRSATGGTPFTVDNAAANACNVPVGFKYY